MEKDSTRTVDMFPASRFAVSDHRRDNGPGVDDEMISDTWMEVGAGMETDIVSGGGAGTVMDIGPGADTGDGRNHIAKNPGGMACLAMMVAILMLLSCMVSFVIDGDAAEWGGEKKAYFDLSRDNVDLTLVGPGNIIFDIIMMGMSPSELIAFFKLRDDLVLEKDFGNPKTRYYVFSSTDKFKQKPFFYFIFEDEKGRAEGRLTEFMIFKDAASLLGNIKVLFDESLLGSDPTERDARLGPGGIFDVDHPIETMPEFSQTTVTYKRVGGLLVIGRNTGLEGDQCFISFKSRERKR